MISRLEMDVLFLSSIWTFSILHIFAVSFEVTVIQSELKPCDGLQRVCVTEPSDCSPPSPSSVQKKPDVWCDYRHSAGGGSSLTCGGDLDSGSEASLVIGKRNRVVYCPAVLNPASTLNVTARIRDVKTGGDVWSGPHTVILHQAVRPPQPVLTPLSDDSLLVSWRSRSDGHCRFRYRLNIAHVWTQAPDSVSVHTNHNASYTLTGLLPFTAYRASVSCRKEPAVWTGWSPDAAGRTRDRVPSWPLDVCYRLEETLADAPLGVWLMWKPLDPGETGGRVLGYTVTSHPGGETHNVTEPTAFVTVGGQDGAATVAAFNTAGSGPVARVRIDPGRHGVLPSVRHMWVSSLYPDQTALCVQWRGPAAPTSVPPPSRYVVLWRDESGAIGGWSAVSGFNTSAVIRDVEPDGLYFISVFPVYDQQCGPAESLPASVKRGALMEPDLVKVLSATKTSVTVTWAWLNKSGPIRVKSYRVTLKKDQDTQTRTIWRDQNRLTFFNLTPNTQYSLQLLADHLTTHTVQVKTSFDEKLLVTPLSLLLLLMSLLIVSVVSGTVCKSYCFPPISNPRDSSTYRWLKDRGTPKHTEKNILDISSFQVTELLGDKGLTVVSPNPRLQSGEHLQREDVGSLIQKPVRRQPDQVQTAGDGGEDEDRRAHGRVQEERVTLSSFSCPAGPNDGHYVHQVICGSDSLIKSTFLGLTEGSDLVCDSEYKNIGEDPQTDGAEETDEDPV